MKTSRRAFLKLFIGGVAVAACPIPKFLLTQTQKNELDKLNRGLSYGQFGGPAAFDATGSALTVEMIEEAVARSAMNMGQADRIYMSKKNYKAVAKQFGFRVVYDGDEIYHYEL